MGGNLPFGEWTETFGSGFTDGEIVEANQICAGFNYWTRSMNGLGVDLDSWAGLNG